MTALPHFGQLLTIADYVASPGDDRRRWELVEGNLVMSPSPTPRHMIALGQLFTQLRRQLPASHCVVPDVDLDLEFAPAGQPGTARRPDLVVVSNKEFQRVDTQGGLLRASAAALVIEIISPGSRRTDEVFKRDDYADAGISHYWIVDLGGPISLTPCHLAAGFGYQDAGAATGIYECDEPFPMRIDLDSLA